MCVYIGHRDRRVCACSGVAVGVDKRHARRKVVRDTCVHSILLHMYV